METVNIKQLSCRYHLQPQQRELQRELDDTVSRAFGEELDRALARLGIDNREEICLRLVQVPMEFDSQQSRQRNAELWSRHIAEAIDAALAGRSGDSANIVRYPSRLHGLVDFALEVSAGRTSRAWAWSQLGWCSLPHNPPPAEARRQLVNALEREPVLLLPLFVRLAKAGRLRGLLYELPPDDCRALLRVIFTNAGVRSLWLNGGEPGINPADNEIDSGNNPAPIAICHSTIARHLLENPRVLPDRSAIPLRQWLSLCLIELEPALFSRGHAAIAAQISAAEAQWCRLAGEDGREVSSARHSRKDRQTRDEHLRRGVRSESSQSGKQQNNSFPGGEALRSTGGKRGDYFLGIPVREQSAEGLRQIVETEGVAETDEMIESLRPETGVFRSEWAGIFYLLPLLGGNPQEEGIVNILIGSEEFSRRSMSWIFFQFFRLAFECADCEFFPAADPAPHLLCNLPEDEEVPGFEDPEDLELSVLDTQVRRLHSALEASLPQPELSPGERWHWLCQRDARLQADPAWVEVIFPLQGLDTEVRRAGLDLDPGYVHWLGRVVKIRYE